MMTEVRLFELACKGDRLDEINAEAVLDQQAKAVIRWQVLLKRLHWLLTALSSRTTTPSEDKREVILSVQP